MNKKLAKKKKKRKKYFFSLWIFRKTVGPHWVGRKDVGEGWKTLNGKIQSVFCAVYEVQAWVSLAHFGPVWSSSVRGTRRLLLGAADAWQMAVMVCCEVPAMLFFYFYFFVGLLVMFLQQHDCIISVHTWQNRARFPLKCPGTQIVFVLFTFFYFSFFLSLHKVQRWTHSEGVLGKPTSNRRQTAEVISNR